MRKTISMAVTIVIVILINLTSVFAEKQQLDIKWVEGPTNVNISGIAKLDLSGDYRYANKEDTVKIMEYIGNPSSKAEIGSIFPKNQNENWYIVFEYSEIGHVKDKDKDKINADELLKSYKKGNEEANKIRRKNGIPELHIKDWIEKPNYNEDLHSLVWGILCESADGNTANYESRLLCREGYVSATLVCSDTELNTYKTNLKKVIDKFSFVEGKRYEDYVEGQDKLSDLGLAALIVGGTAVAAKKGILVILLAFLKKGGVLILAPIIALFGKLFGRKKSGKATEENDDNNNALLVGEAIDTQQNTFSEVEGEIAASNSVEDNIKEDNVEDNNVEDDKSI